MKIKAFVIVDTNVLISATLTPSYAPLKIVELMEKGNLIPIFDRRMLDEYFKVFHYDKFKDLSSSHFISEKMYNKTIGTVVNNGILINSVDTIKQELYDLMPDKKDIPFFEVKESSQEFDLINDYPIPNDSYIVTPKELLIVLQQMDRFIRNDLE